jgi:hypothetical protein
LIGVGGQQEYDSSGAVAVFGGGGAIVCLVAGGVDAVVWVVIIVFRRSAMDGIAALFKDDYMLSEILLFLPPQPSSLPIIPTWPEHQTPTAVCNTSA